MNLSKKKLIIVRVKKAIEESHLNYQQNNNTYKILNFDAFIKKGLINLSQFLTIMPILIIFLIVILHHYVCHFTILASYK